MIKFISISGFVTIDERNSLQCIDPKVGMTMSDVGADFIIATGNDGIAEIDINNHYVLVTEDSTLHVRSDGRSFLKKHKESWFGKNSVRMGCGRAWAWIESMAGNEEGEEILQGNAVVGIRG